MAVETRAIIPMRRKFSSAEYHQLTEIGILKEAERVELVDGEIIQMTPIGDKHPSGVINLSDLLYENLRDVGWVSVQNSARLAENSEPQPDVVVLGRLPGRYKGGRPAPSDVLLLMEVSDSSLQYDRDVKVPLYARAGIPETWLVDLEGNALLVYRDPSPDGYKTSFVVRRGESVTPVSFPGRELTVADILG